MPAADNEAILWQS